MRPALRGWLFEVVGADRNEIDPREIGRRRRVGLRRALLADQPLERGAAFRSELGRDRLPGARQRDHVGEDIARGEQHVDHVRRRLHAALPDGVEDGLEHVGELDERLETENAGAALDRMNAAENRVHRVLGPGAFAHVGEPGLDLLQQLVAFLEEGALELIQVRHDA